MERAGQYGVYFIFQSMEQGPTFPSTMPMIPPPKIPTTALWRSNRNRFKALTPISTLTGTKRWRLMLMRVAYFPFQTTYYPQRPLFH